MLRIVKNIVLFITFILLASCAGLQPSRTTDLGQGIKDGSFEQQTITLMLPLHGRYANQGKAIRNGFLAAFYYDKKHRRIQNRVNIIDTESGPIETLYQKALNEGSHAIVGPLTKNHVQALARLNPEIPVLALNQISHAKAAKLYQFGLSPVDEAVEIAQQAGRQGYQRALIIAPQTTSGKLLAQTFKNTWQSQGLKVTDVFLYPDNMQTLSSGIAQLLKVIEVDKEDPDSVPSRRDDIDVILLAANPIKALEINALLKFNYAGEIPIYTTSSIYNPNWNVSKNKELDGIYFSISPWMLKDSLTPKLASIRQNIQMLWPQDFKHYASLYALGVDAYNLISHTADPAICATGILTIDSQRHIHRRLLLARFQQGVPVLIHD